MYAAVDPKYAKLSVETRVVRVRKPDHYLEEVLRSRKPLVTGRAVSVEDVVGVGNCSADMSLDGGALLKLSSYSAARPHLKLIIRASIQRRRQLPVKLSSGISDNHVNVNLSFMDTEEAINLCVCG